MDVINGPGGYNAGFQAHPVIYDIVLVLRFASQEPPIQLREQLQIRVSFFSLSLSLSAAVVGGVGDDDCTTFFSALCSKFTASFAIATISS